MYLKKVDECENNNTYNNKHLTTLPWSNGLHAGFCGIAISEVPGSIPGGVNVKK